MLALDSSSRDNTHDAETITGIFIAVHKFVHLSWQKYYGVYCIVSPDMTFTSHKKPASAKTCDDSCCSQGHKKVDILRYNDYMEEVIGRHIACMAKIINL